MKRALGESFEEYKRKKDKKLEEINEREKQLTQENEKDQAIINDENAFPQDKEEAKARLEQRN